MARKKGWRSSTKKRPHLTWVTDEGTNLTAPTPGVADNDNLCNANDWGDSSEKNRVLVRRILFEVWWAPASLSSVAAASFHVDFALIATAPDQMAAATVSALTAVGFYPLDARIIRMATKRYTESGQASAVGAFTPGRPPNWTVNLRTRFVLTEPQSLYFYQRPTQTDGTSDVYEYSYRSRVLVQKLD